MFSPKMRCKMISCRAIELYLMHLHLITSIHWLLNDKDIKTEKKETTNKQNENSKLQLVILERSFGGIFQHKTCFSLYQ